MRHAGLGWPNGASDDERIYRLPSPLLLMCSPEARWRLDRARARGKQVLWRSIPRQGKRPAELGWNPRKIADECLNLYDEQGGASDFLDLNELDLQDERGDRLDDGFDLSPRYALIGGVLQHLTQEYRQRLPGVTLHFPAWTPDHRALEYTDAWRAAAEGRDVIDLHAYGRTADIREQYEAYRAAFPGKLLAITEWHSANVGDDRETLEYLARLAAEDPLFWGATYFNWQWFGGWGDYMNVVGNATREVLFTNPPGIVPAPTPPEEPMTEYEQFCRSEAARRGINPDTAVTVANSEGSLTEPARRGTFDTGSSWWAFQLHYGGDQYPQYGTVAGMGNSFTSLTGWAPGDPAAWRDAMRYALDAARVSGWGAWYGARARGITGFDGIDRSVPWGGTPAGEWEYQTVVKPVPAPLAFDPATPDERQRQSWSCAIRAAAWAIKSLGPHRGEVEFAGDLQDYMIAKGFENPNVGLTDARGYGLQATLAAYLPAGTTTTVNEAVTWEWLMANAGKGPICLGGRRFGAGGHWVGVRGVGETGVVIMNPAGSYAGVSDLLTRATFDTLGPWSAVLATVAVAPPMPENDELSALRSAVGYLTVDLLEKRITLIEAELAALRVEGQRVKAQMLG